jgi:hypothetical protein
MKMIHAFHLNVAKRQGCAGAAPFYSGPFGRNKKSRSEARQKPGGFLSEPVRKPGAARPAGSAQIREN